MNSPYVKSILIVILIVFVILKILIGDWSFLFATLLIINFWILYRCSSKIRIALAAITIGIVIFLFANSHFNSELISNDIIKFSNVWSLVALWNLLSVLFDFQLKRRLKFDESELYKYHIDLIENFLDVETRLYKDFPNNLSLTDCGLISNNQKNLASYIKLKNNQNKLLTTVYKNSYESFAKNILKQK